MKKAIAFVVIIVLCILSMACAEVDFSSMSYEEISNIIENAKRELQKRVNPKWDSVTVYDENNIRIVFEEIKEIQYRPNDTILYVKHLTENNSGQHIKVTFSNVYINDFYSHISFYPTDVLMAGKKVRDVVAIPISDAGIHSFYELESLTFRLEIRDVWDNLLYYKYVDLFFNKD